MSFRKSRIDHRFHLSLSLGTLGLWLSGWLLVALIHMLKPWNCTKCGKRVSSLSACFRPSPPQKAAARPAEGRDEDDPFEALALLRAGEPAHELDQLSRSAMDANLPR